MNAEGYLAHETLVQINSTSKIPVVLMFNLKKDMDFYGIPRLAFVLLTGKKGEHRKNICLNIQ